MHILRIRPGFQADHSSSLYVFYAVDGAVSAKGQKIAHQYSSRADVDEQFARYQKWGESDLSSEAFPALLGEHYDVMASESYDSWTLMIALPKTAALAKALEPFRDLDDGEFTRLSVHDYGKRLAVEIFCEFDYGGPVFEYEEDSLEGLVELLADIRQELLAGDVSFLQAVADYYLSDTGAGEDAGKPPAPEAILESTKTELQQECTRRGIEFRKSWNKSQLQQALATAAPTKALAKPAKPAGKTKPPKLSKAAQRIVASLTDNR